MNDGSFFDDQTFPTLLRSAPVFAPRGSGLPGSVLQTDTPSSALQRLVDRSDVLVLWGLGPDAHRLLGRVDWKSTRIILQSHGTCNWTADMLRNLGRFATDFMSVSSAAAEPFPAAVRSRVAVVNNGVEPARCVASRPRREMLSQWGLPAHARTVGYLGRLAVEKRPEAAVRAAVALGGPWFAVLVGAGKDRETVTQRAKSLAGHRVRVIPPIEHVGDALGAFDCLVSASPTEGFSLAMVEAWMAGVPTVSTPVGVVPELESKHGPLIFPIRDDFIPSEVASAVERATSGTWESRLIVGRARKVASHFLTANHMRAKFIDLVLKVRGKPPV